MRRWRIEDSEELYNIQGWGRKYFSINEKGNVAVTPREGFASVDLREVMDELQVRDITSPVLLRFPDILDNRIEKISNCFAVAAEQYNYKAQNYIIYPIKVNQMRPVVEEIVTHGEKFNIGLEAGSKPELHAVLATNIKENALIICNGYKDQTYIELALLAQKMGRRIYLVVEKLNELKTIAEVARRIGIDPNVGIRIKLASSGSGKWETSGGDQSKFGLNSSELLEALDFMERNKMKHCLKLIHFHIGSQITKIRRIKNAIREATQFYVQLTQMGFDIDFMDIGGGLGVDYDGTRNSASGSSMNYSIQEYANDAVSAIVDACEKNGLKQPNIINESGRSLTAHHSVLVFEVLETTQLPFWKDSEDISEADHELAKELYDIWDKLNQQRLLESWHDALQIREEALDLFSLGMLDLRTRAQIEKLFWSIAREVGEIADSMKHAPEELRKVEHLANAKVRQAIALDERRCVPIDEARAMGAMALFGEKYGDEVRVIRYGSSVELCGGTHVANTGNIGMIKIISESSIAAGIRRIEAITGETVENAIDQMGDTLKEMGTMLHNTPDVIAAMKRSIEENAELRQQVEDFMKERTTMLVKSLLEASEVINGIQTVCITGVRLPDMVKNIAFGVRAASPENTAFLGATTDPYGKPLLTVMISNDLVEAGRNASAMVREAAKAIKGGGGGQPGFAQAGGKDGEGISTAMEILINSLKK